MTRFARAKGSKASNERAPEDSTPWEVMKEQMQQSKKEAVDSKKRQEAENQRIENYQNFLNEQKTTKKKASWCDFPESNTSKNPASQKSDQPPKKKSKKSKIINSSNDNDLASEDLSVKQKKKKNKQKKKSNFDETNSKTDNNDLDKTSNVQDTEINFNEQKSDTSTKTQEKNFNKKKVKQHDGKPIRRKEINDRSFQLIINGKEVELTRFDGFPIMKKDAERLQDLKNSMIKKGIPKSEVQRTLKLERRRAEKALARLKRDVCYNCRKGGHNLSDCPDLKSKIPGVDAADGVCFKCGSTEHKQFDCKVQKNKEFKFATCFICKEAGHIARQCPDNPKGLYPNGGSCKLCGDVTHLRKDCPTATEKKEETSIKLHTLDEEHNVEDIAMAVAPVSQETVKKPKKIKF